MRGRYRCNQSEAAHRLGVTPGVLRRLVAAGALEVNRVGNEWCFDVVEIERYAKSRRACGIR